MTEPAPDPAATPPNGTDPLGQAKADQQAAQVAEFVMANYGPISVQLGAISTLLMNIPLAPLLEACKRRQTVSILTLPGQASGADAAALAAQLRNDERIIEAALNLQNTLRAVHSGQ
jgi:hypothetical protein